MNIVLRTGDLLETTNQIFVYIDKGNCYTGVWMETGSFVIVVCGFYVVAACRYEAEIFANIGLVRITHVAIKALRHAQGYCRREI